MNMDNKITATIITFNEQANIERCLKSILWVDEIVVVDSYSSDNTIEICKKYNCKIIQAEWMGFGKTKKFAVDSASHDWILSIDSDEEVTEQLKDKIQQTLAAPEYYGFKIKRRSHYLGKEIKHCGWDRDYPLRLFNRQFANFNDKEVHESVILNGKKGRIHESFLHYTYPTISSHINKINRYTELAALDGEKKYSLLTSLLFGINKFLKMYLLQKGFLDGKYGFLLCVNSAFGVYLKYIKVWEKRN